MPGHPTWESTFKTLLLLFLVGTLFVDNIAANKLNLCAFKICSKFKKKQSSDVCVISNLVLTFFACWFPEYKMKCSDSFDITINWVTCTLQTHHVYSTLKRSGNRRFHVSIFYGVLNVQYSSIHKKLMNTIRSFITFSKISYCPFQ